MLLVIGVLSLASAFLSAFAQPNWAGAAMALLLGVVGALLLLNFASVRSLRRLTQKLEKRLDAEAKGQIGDTRRHVVDMHREVRAVAEKLTGVEHDLERVRFAQSVATQGVGTVKTELGRVAATTTESDQRLQSMDEELSHLAKYLRLSTASPEPTASVLRSDG
jgi:chromosome segregation ATPase